MKKRILNSQTKKPLLTKKEQQIFNYIEEYQMQNGSSPTVREMRLHMKLKSDGFVIHCVKALVRKGVIKKGDTPRGIKLLPAISAKLHASDFAKIPVLGHIPAGGPVISEEHVEDWISVSEDQIKNPKDCFILKVRGDSMMNAGILDGDFVIASTKPSPRKGDIVVALVDGGNTVKSYMIAGEGEGVRPGMPYLKPENPAFENIYPENDLQVQGVVVGLYRWY